jgi:membrane protease YdiL (CAAX protease family)
LARPALHDTPRANPYVALVTIGSPSWTNIVYDWILNKASSTMQTLSVWDHLYAFGVFVLYPIVAKVTFPAVVRKLRETGEPGRIAAYRHTLITVFGFAVLFAAMWWLLDRPWAELGIRATDPIRIVYGILLCAAVLFGTVAQFQAALKSDAPGFGGVSDDLLTFMPRSRREQAWFRAVSVNAGISEELIFRGFLIWYFSQLLGLTWAAILGVILFTAAHSYQGVKQVPGLAFISAILVGLYLLSGSLLLPILFHAVFDMLQGHCIARILRRRENGDIPELTR